MNTKLTNVEWYYRATMVPDVEVVKFTCLLKVLHNY